MFGARELHRERPVTDTEHAGDQERLAGADPRQHVDDREDHDEDRLPQIQQAAKRP